MVETRQRKGFTARLYLGSSVFSRTGVLSRLVMDANHSKSPEETMSVLGHMLSGRAWTCCWLLPLPGKLKSFARKFIK